jgi:hypothetical protein
MGRAPRITAGLAKGGVRPDGDAKPADDEDHEASHQDLRLAELEPRGLVLTPYAFAGEPVVERDQLGPALDPSGRWAVLLALRTVAGWSRVGGGVKPAPHESVLVAGLVRMKR